MGSFLCKYYPIKMFHKCTLCISLGWDKFHNVCSNKGDTNHWEHQNNYWFSISIGKFLWIVFGFSCIFYKKLVMCILNSGVGNSDIVLDCGMPYMFPEDNLTHIIYYLENMDFHTPCTLLMYNVCSCLKITHRQYIHYFDQHM